MAARAHAAAPLCPDRTVFLESSCTFCLGSVCLCLSSSRLHISRRIFFHEFLLNIRRTQSTDINSADAEKLRDYGLLRDPPTPTPAPSPQWRRHGRNMKKQKRGKRGGIRARLAASPHRPAIPSITLANVRSLDNKLDCIRLLRTSSKTVSECCVFVFVETWLNDSVPDRAIQLARLTCLLGRQSTRRRGEDPRRGTLCLH